MDYRSPELEVRSIADKGRGVFARANLPPGTLVLAEKALAYVPENLRELACSFSGDSKSYNDTAKSKMVPTVVQNLMQHPELGQRLYALSDGERFSDPSAAPSATAVGEDLTKVDVPRIRRILSNNWFSDRSDHILNFVKNQEHCIRENLPPSSVDPSNKLSGGTGLWGTPSLFNHSCAPNCTYLVVGDFHFTITVKPIKESEELTIAYCDPRLPFEERRNLFQHWGSTGRGFECQCERCVYTRRNPGLQQVEKRIAEAYAAATELCGRGFDMHAAGNRAMPVSERAALMKKMHSTPMLQRGSFVRVLEMEVVHLISRDRHEQALQLSRQIMDIEEQVFGVSSDHVEWLKASIRVVSLLLGLRRSSEGTLYERYGAQELLPAMRAMLVRAEETLGK